MKGRVFYKLERDYNGNATTYVFQVVRWTVVEGPDENGRYVVKSRLLGQRTIHGDWLSASPAEAVENAKRHLMRERDRELEAMDAALRGRKK